MSKKTYRLLASLLLMLVATLTSCEKFSIDETTGKSREANANVTIHVQKIEGTSLLTTKAADKQMALSDVCSRLTLAIFDGEEKLETVNQLSTDNGFGTAHVSLDEGEYRLVVIAHNGKGNCSISAPEKVKFASNKLTDTFYYYGRLSVNEEGATTDINLRRAVGALPVPASSKTIEEISQTILMQCSCQKHPQRQGKQHSNRSTRMLTCYPDSCTHDTSSKPACQRPILHHMGIALFRRLIETPERQPREKYQGSVCCLPPFRIVNRYPHLFILKILH